MPADFPFFESTRLRVWQTLSAGVDPKVGNPGRTVAADTAIPVAESSVVAAPEYRQVDF
jgi:hypothetical protein